MVDARQPPQAKRQRPVSNVIAKDSGDSGRHRIANSGQKLVAPAPVRRTFPLVTAAQLSGQVESETGCRRGGRHRVRLHHDGQIPVETAKSEIRRLHFGGFGQLRRRMAVPEMQRPVMAAVVVTHVIRWLAQRRQVARAATQLVMLVVVVVVMVRRQGRSRALVIAAACCRQRSRRRRRAGRAQRKSQIRFVEGARIGHRQLELEFAIGVGEVALVKVIDGNVAAITLGRRVERELDLPATERLIGAEMLSVEQCEGKINVHSHPLQNRRTENGNR